jgi:hypothetical protein
LINTTVANHFSKIEQKVTIIAINLCALFQSVFQILLSCMHFLHPGLRAINSLWPKGRFYPQAGKQFLHPGRQQANLARLENANFA